ncbi:MAG TPA: Uma2 family endonuclease [Bacteroidetes bacterium]|nr:Uma2 family endonuclease [Bacteroidota bacterium]
MITNINQLDFSKKYNYSDYLTWQFKERVELLKGYIFKMSPAPNVRHQRISGDIYFELRKFLVDKPCQVFSAPFDVRLPLPKEKQKEGKIDTVVQPDITVICEESKLDEQGCNGAPDLVIEILSPGNTKKEMKNKLEIYQLAGIPEYWLVDPEHAFVIIYTLNEQANYIGSIPFTDEDKARSFILKGFELDLSKVFK